MTNIAKRIQHESMSYPESLIQSWTSGDYSMLTSSNASDYIKRIIVHKAKNRPGRRFFGEAFIASKIEMREGWYNSFKWLTAAKWITGKGLKPEFEKPFYDALMKYIGEDILSEIQEEALSLYLKQDGESFRKPVAPDLWLIDKKGKFRFIESKLPRDKIHHNQLDGLNLIKKYLGPRSDVTVSIMELCPK